jgi:hypothetical protein
VAAAAAAVLSLMPAHVATQSQGSEPTPRTADGKPDLSGRWGGGGGGGTVNVVNAQGQLVQYKNFADIPKDENVRIKARIYGGRRGSPTWGERDAGMRQRLFSNPPLYKPEYWEKVEYLDLHGNYEDSNFRCMPPGVPRIGPPNRIVQTAEDIVFLYNAGNSFRVIPIDGRPHDPINSLDQTYNGDSVGHWEGDTLVVDVVGFNEETWLGWPGWFHTVDMRVVERLRREGNTLHYQATVHDPEVLMEPWTMDPRVLRLNTTKGPYVEQPPCVPDPKPMVSRERG